MRAGDMPGSRPRRPAQLRAWPGVALSCAVLLAACTGDDAPADLLARPDAPAPYARPVYTLLSKAGLYSDPASKTLASDLVYFAPTHVLWSDGAHKRRWIRLPPGTRIDTSDMDHWVPPV